MTLTPPLLTVAVMLPGIGITLFTDLEQFWDSSIPPFEQVIPLSPAFGPKAGGRGIGPDRRERRHDGIA